MPELEPEELVLGGMVLGCVVCTVLAEVVCPLDVLGVLELPVEDVPGVVPGIVRCSVERLEDDEVGVVLVVEPLWEVEDVCGGGAGVDPCKQLHALLTRMELLPQPCK